MGVQWKERDAQPIDYRETSLVSHTRKVKVNLKDQRKQERNTLKFCSCIITRHEKYECNCPGMSMFIESQVPITVLTQIPEAACRHKVLRPEDSKAS